MPFSPPPTRPLLGFFFICIFLLTHPVSAFYQLALRTKRGEWFGNFYNYKSGSSLLGYPESHCVRYTGTTRTGDLTAVIVYNKPGEAIATAIAFYADGICGASKRQGQLTPSYVAILDPNNPDGIWIINFQKVVGVAVKINSFVAINYEAELRPGGLLNGINGNSSEVIYAWTPDRDGQFRRKAKITGGIERVTNGFIDLGNLQDSGDLYMGLRDLAERAIRPGSESIPNPVAEYLRGVAAGEPGYNRRPWNKANSNDPDKPAYKPARSRNRKDRSEGPQGLYHILSKYITPEDADPKIQTEFMQFLEDEENEAADYQLEIVPSKHEDPKVDDDVLDDQRLVKEKSLGEDDDNVAGQVEAYQRLAESAIQADIAPSEIQEIISSKPQREDTVARARAYERLLESAIQEETNPQQEVAQQNQISNALAEEMALAVSNPDTRDTIIGSGSAEVLPPEQNARAGTDVLREELARLTNQNIEPSISQNNPFPDLPTQNTAYSGIISSTSARIPGIWNFQPGFIRPQSSTSRGPPSFRDVEAQVDLENAGVGTIKTQLAAEEAGLLPEGDFEVYDALNAGRRRRLDG
ncbi:hypothetical protein ABW20_dc0102529 [Dactylellina cionopaga]|nr:hypothetical protein ABW20_dc0102529 [Dactylellina cionopaga]